MSQASACAQIFKSFMFETTYVSCEEIQFCDDKISYHDTTNATQYTNITVTS